MNHTNSMLALAAMYSAGAGVEQDDVMATNLWRRAAKKSVVAMQNLGKM